MSTGRPLDGVLVVSVEQAVAAPLASCRLADAGARVIKVERPGGDFARGYDSAAGDGLSSYFAWLNRGKESIVLNLKDDDDRSLLARMVARADVFIQNLAVGVADRLGFGSAALRERHPRLVACDISGYGASGSYAHMKAYDLLIQAESGLISVSGAPGPLGRVGVSVADIATGEAAARAISQALVRQARSGQGARIETSLFATMAEWMTVPLLHHDGLGRAPERVGLAHPSIAPYGGFETADGTTLLIAVQSDGEWRTLCRLVLDRPELADDPRFATNRARVTNRADTDGVVAEVFSRHSTEQLHRLLGDSRMAFSTVNDVAGLSAHPQLRRRAVAHADTTVDLPAPATTADWDAFDTDPPPSLPTLDQHRAQLREEFAQDAPPAP
ncbi:CaiB/BaiF CoA transferase family protein [Candidatus Poriferisocius sp.]|uniref:CaiB/BaiF CoA transferase family protein n=1 Tax=Candidatus Poriferisocius sp. TaxID=3101276 RepID=UPI003B5C4AC7